MPSGSPSRIAFESTMLRAPALRRLEAVALSQSPPGALMQRAGIAVAAVCARHLYTLPRGHATLALIGPGHNGGDALFAAAELVKQGHRVAAIVLDPQAPTVAGTEAARQAWLAIQPTLSGPEAFSTLIQDRPVIIDGLFGLGLSRPLTNRAADWARAIRAQASWVLAVDVPSGLDAGRGCILGPPGSVAVRADCTVTLLANKPGLHTGDGCEHAGTVIVADLDLDHVWSSSLTGGEGEPAEQGIWFTAHERAGLISPRHRNTHKGAHGNLLVVMGHHTMQGAGILAALGAHAVGTGRIYLGEQAQSPAPICDPEWLRRTLRLDDEVLHERLGFADAIVIGCGLGQTSVSESLVMAALAHHAALVLDADALNILSAHADWPQWLHARHAAGRVTVLTPHPLEAARLLRTDTHTVQYDRVASACSLAARAQATVVLKGAGTVVAQPDGTWAINRSGHPILAVAGTGDVLAGTLGGLLAQGLSAADAACLGVWLHGAAGDALAAKPEMQSGIGLRASELAPAIRAQINQYSNVRP